MDKKLSQWAKENNVSYPTAYFWFKNNKLPVNASVNPGGSIMVHEPEEKKVETFPRLHPAHPRAIACFQVIMYRTTNKLRLYV